VRSLNQSETALLIIYFLFLILHAYSGGKPGYRPPDPYPYPLVAVLVTSAIMGLELAAFWAILRPRTYCRSWQRSLVATLIFLPWGVFCVGLLMHMPGYIVGHAVWALLLGVVAFSVLAVSLVSLAFHRVSKGAA
jgi:hypothetical protein